MPRYEALEILRSEAYLDVRRNKPAPCSTRGRMRGTKQMGVFQHPAISLTGIEDADPVSPPSLRIVKGLVRHLDQIFFCPGAVARKVRDP